MPRLTFVLFVALVAALVPAAGRAQLTSHPDTRPVVGRVVLEGALGAAAERTRRDVDGSDAPSLLAAHAAFGIAIGARFAIYGSRDVGSVVRFDGPSTSYAYSTAFVELAPTSAPLLAGRLGVGFGTEHDGRRGDSGPVARLGVALRTPPDHDAALVLAVDGFAALGGSLSAPRAYEGVDHSPIRPLTLAASLGLRLQFPVHAATAPAT